MLAAAWPSAIQIWRVNAATDVFPLVPVTAAITSGWREKNFAAVSASARRASATLMKATASGSSVAGGRSAMTAAAVRRSASFMAMRSRPFTRFLAFAWCRQIRAAFRRRKGGNGLSPAHARQNQLVGGRQVEARLEPEQGGDAADDGAPDRPGVPSRGGEAVRVRRRLRFIEHDEKKV